MSKTPHINHLLHDYLDGTLPAAERQAVAQHLQTCPTCHAEAEALRVLMADLDALPRRIEPPRDLWTGIEARIAPPAKPARLFRMNRWTMGVAAAVVLLIGLWAVLSLLPTSEAWPVATLEGTPQIGEARIADKGRLRVGQWLATDAASRAHLEVGEIGFVEVAPETRIQLVEAAETDHRLALAEGQIEARIFAPPRLFFVETPSALAIDLGCAYTLTVDSTGSSLIHVTSGYVELVEGPRNALVPAGAMGIARPGFGPGTPFDQKATPALRQALYRYDFEEGGTEALTEILALVRPTDTISLWHLLERAAPEEHSRLYDRLAALVPEPPGITKTGVLSGDTQMREIWRHYLGLDVAGMEDTTRKKKQVFGR